MNDQKHRGTVKRHPKVGVGERSDALPEALGQGLDLLNERLREVETRLQRYGVVAYVSAGEDDGLSTHGLLFDKRGNQWRILHLERSLLDGGTTEQLVLSASRSVRLAAVRFLPALVEEVKANAMREAVAVQDALKSLETVLRTLPPSASPDALVDDDENDCPF